MIIHIFHITTDSAECSKYRCASAVRFPDESKELQSYNGRFRYMLENVKDRLALSLEDGRPLTDNRFSLR